MTSLISKNLVTAPKLEIENSPACLLSVGRLSPEKGLGVALRAIAQLKFDDNIQVNYFIVGDGAERAGLARLCEELQISELVNFVGKVPLDEIYVNWYPRSDAYLLPSFSEGIPKVILEAMAFGLPVIATDVGGVGAMIGEDGERGWLIVPQQVNALAQAIRECLTDSALRARKTRAAHQYIKDHTLEAETGRIQGQILKTLTMGADSTYSAPPTP